MVKVNSKASILITGAATGVGLATAQAISQAGFNVIATALPGQNNHYRSWASACVPTIWRSLRFK